MYKIVLFAFLIFSSSHAENKILNHAYIINKSVIIHINQFAQFIICNIVQVNSLALDFDIQFVVSIENPQIDDELHSSFQYTHSTITFAILININHIIAYTIDIFHFDISSSFQLAVTIL